MWKYARSILGLGVLAVVAVALVSSFCTDQSVTPIVENPVTISTTLTPCDREGYFDLKVTAIISSGYHIYPKLPNSTNPYTQITIESGANFEIIGESLYIPAVVISELSASGEVFEGSVVWGFILRFPNIVKGYPTVRGTIRYTACSNNVCMMPKEVQFVAEVK
jgi:hypothetical protein